MNRTALYFNEATQDYEEREVPVQSKEQALQDVKRLTIRDNSISINGDFSVSKHGRDLYYLYDLRTNNDGPEYCGSAWQVVERAYRVA